MPANPNQKNVDKRDHFVNDYCLAYYKAYIIVVFTTPTRDKLHVKMPTIIKNRIIICIFTFSAYGKCILKNPQ
jgi:hypothetical protein